MPRKKKEETTSNYKYQTIASTDRDFKTYDVMNTYNTIVEARTSYLNDVKTWKADDNHKEYKHYGIKEIR